MKRERRSTVSRVRLLFTDMLRMKSRSIAIAGLTLLIVTAVEAKWARLSNEELIERSQLIVAATLVAGEDGSFELQGMPVAILRAIRIYRGQADGTQIYLKLLPKGKPISSSDLVYRSGQSGIWFLKESEYGSGIFYIDHPQRFWPLEREPLLLQLLKQRSSPAME